MQQIEYQYINILAILANKMGKRVDKYFNKIGLSQYTEGNERLENAGARIQFSSPIIRQPLVIEPNCRVGEAKGVNEIQIISKISEIQDTTDGESYDHTPLSDSQKEEAELRYKNYKEVTRPEILRVIADTQKEIEALEKKENEK